MLHEVLSHVIHLAEGAPTAAEVLPVALIGAAALVLSALIQGWFGTRHERDRRDETDGGDRIEVEAAWDVAHAEESRRVAEGEARMWHARYEVLCAALWRRGFDPNKFLRGDESDHDTRF